MTSQFDLTQLYGVLICDPDLFLTFSLFMNFQTRFH